MALYNYKRSHYKAGRELGYERVMPDLKLRIFSCKSEDEVDRVMVTCRHLMGGR